MTLPDAIFRSEPRGFHRDSVRACVRRFVCVWAESRDTDGVLEVAGYSRRALFICTITFFATLQRSHGQHLLVAEWSEFRFFFPPLFLLVLWKAMMFRQDSVDAESAFTLSFTSWCFKGTTSTHIDGYLRNKNKISCNKALHFKTPCQLKRIWWVYIQDNWRCFSTGDFLETQVFSVPAANDKPGRPRLPPPPPPSLPPLPSSWCCLRNSSSRWCKTLATHSEHFPALGLSLTREWSWELPRGNRKIQSKYYWKGCPVQFECWTWD